MSNPSDSKPVDNNVIDFFSGKPLEELAQERIIRLSPELDGLSMLYSNQNNPDRFFTMKILCWGLRWNGEVVGMVPWLDELVACPEINDPLHGSWEGYYNPKIDTIFYDAPMHKVVELETALAYFENDSDVQDGLRIMQEIPDNIGTHAMLIGEDEKKLVLQEVSSWRLFNSGDIEAMLVDVAKAENTPVLTGDPCLYAAHDNPQFRYFFQHHIANQIKNEDPEAMEAIKLLLNR